MCLDVLFITLKLLFDRLDIILLQYYKDNLFMRIVNKNSKNVIKSRIFVHL
jgi:hypothetical protein